MTFVVAPLGFGKTVAVRQWLATSGISHSWFDVDVDGANSHALVEAIGGAVRDSHCIAIDNADRLPPDDIAALVSLVEREKHGAWVLIARSAEAWPLARWIDAGLCRFPISTGDLGFTSDESLEMLRDLCRESGRDAHDVYSLTLLADGWPIVLGFAAAAIRAGVAELLAATRTVVEQYIRSEVFAPLTSEEWDLLVQAASVGYVSPEWVGILQGRGTAISDAALQSLRMRVPWLALDERQWRLPKVVRDSVNQRALADYEKFQSSLKNAGGVNEASGRFYAAIRAYLMAGDLDAVEQVVRRDGLTSGFALDASLLGTGLLRGANGTRRPLIMALAGIRLARRFLPRDARAAFTAALEGADDLERPIIATAYAQALLLMRESAMALTYLKRYPPADDEHLKLSHLAVKASAELLSGDPASARASYLRARALLPRASRGVSLCWSLMYLADVARFLGDLEDGDKFNAWALRMARLYSLASLEAKCLYYRFPRERDALQTYPQELWTLERAAALASEANDHLLESRALKALVDIWVRRGNEEEIEYYESRLRGVAPPVPLDSDWVCMRSYAMRSAWKGDFQAASEFTQQSLEAFRLPEWRVLRMAEYSLYATQWDRDRAFIYEDEILRELDAVPNAARRANASAVFGAALAIAGRPYRDHLSRAESEAAASGSERAVVFVRSLLAFAHAMRRGMPFAAEHDDALRANNLGGWARVLALVKPVSEKRIKLSPMQMRVLQAIRRGLKSNAIAAELNVAPGTVKKHVDRICERLGVAGRVAAVATAQRYGLFED